VQQLIDLLETMPADAEIIFTPEEYCSSGYPVWVSCHADNLDTKADANRVVEITLEGEFD
jgi:hypothetical protein